MSVNRFMEQMPVSESHLMYGVLFGTWNFAPGSKSISLNLSTGGAIPWMSHLQKITDLSIYYIHFVFYRFYNILYHCCIK